MSSKIYNAKHSKHKKYKPEHQVNIIFMFAGDARIETQALVNAKQKMRINIDHVCFIDKYSKHEATEVVDNLLPHCKRIVTGLFIGMYDYFMKLRAQDMKHVLCIAIHPSLNVFYTPHKEHDADHREMMRVLDHNDPSSITHKYNKRMLRYEKQQAGMFYRLICANFNVQEIGYIWRDGNICVMPRPSQDDLLSIDHIDFYEHFNQRNDCVYYVDYKSKMKAPRKSTSKKPSTSKKNAKKCPPGKEVNPNTNRCVKECPKDKFRNPMTRRCVKTIRVAQTKN